ncbi:hypothetical protein [uncultured Ramlibacter sp.]|mgnify:CR=1 FL=1|uniref:hypothetical protein n=1 Tax=uncultured Ramlibacter sp. TaxID=260755 RepID=UPI00262751D4|nr:hypothetical protein [uncultured Ramlibacter sp.]
MPDFKLPLSGDVIQAINPWNWAFRSEGSQFGLVNINLGKSADPDLEQRILDEVGSYGRQLGRMGEALQVLLDHVKLERLDAKERAVLDDFRLQLDQVQRMKARHGRGDPAPQQPKTRR